MTGEEASARQRRRPQETRDNKTELTSLFLKHKILDLQVAVTPTKDGTKRNDKRSKESEERHVSQRHNLSLLAVPFLLRRQQYSAH